ncbi:hypothetical protein GCM10010468_37170 [Actinocorallia longicatena]|uniref:Uncharacterized protein n=1 Tax=Actinocorallia longicatena TaxID=111803 RepID=A0ABP6QBG6_9ACTN
MVHAAGDTEAEAAELAALRAAWPGWHVRKSGASGWWKATRPTRPGPLRREGCTLISETAAGLGAELLKYRELALRGAFEVTY